MAYIYIHRAGYRYEVGTYVAKMGSRAHAPKSMKPIASTAIRIVHGMEIESRRNGQIRTISRAQE